MPKKPVSITLDEDNLVWLNGVTERSGARSLSETIDRLITTARQSGASAGRPRSVVGTLDIAAIDPQLEGADEALRSVFAESMTRPFLVKEERVRDRSARRRRG
jgi:hypothetical protein